MKKLLSLMLVLAIVLALPLVGLADTVEVTEPITITLVHSRSSGVHLDEMNRVVEEFNKTNDKGITVIAEYGGGCLCNDGGSGHSVISMVGLAWPCPCSPMLCQSSSS